MNDPSYRNWNRWLLRGVLVYVPLSFLTPLLMYQFRDNNRLIVIDGRNSYHVTKYASQEQLVRLYEYMARLGTDALLMRNPAGLDRPELFDEMYVGQARQKALDLLKAEAENFGKQELHQKAEILGIQVLEADSRTSFLKISGQLLRNSGRNLNASAEILQFELSMNLVVNYDLGKNAVYPFVVSDINFNQQSIRK
ncbi:hypothetical protein FYJ85_18815 [Victivallaceae bacterium BBE-744-WT-12]|mgnify:FL=1|jgi:hypothetical protein|uniref:Uncharacterized protein n=2 Tax=Victivallis TaxID=172900 RepID=A0A848AS36_9BACT|nr:MULTISPECIES: hypothetical protein [Victivallis]MST99090.1 hypothetical protein [Victivallis lenta]NMD85811.1 hypothetical protein [Victivallis vadensis]